MKPDAETLLANAEGEISPQAFTGDSTGLFTRTYLNGRSIYERLHENEKIHYLLTNRSDGVTVVTDDGSEPRQISPDSGFRALAAVTSQRIFFVIGKESRDRFIELSGGEITNATLESGLLSTELTFETGAKSYTFGVSKRKSSDPEAAVSYVTTNLLVRSSEGPTASSANSESDSSTTTRPVTVDGGTIAESGDAKQGTPASRTQDTDNSDRDSSSDSSIAVFVNDEECLSDETARRLEATVELIDQTDPKSDDLRDAISALELAKKGFQDVVDDPGVASESIEKAIDQIDSKLESLLEIRSALIKVKRKVALSEGGIEISRTVLEQLASSVDNAIETAEELGWSPGTLEKYRKRLDEMIRNSDSVSSPSKSSRENTSTEGSYDSSSGFTFDTDVKESATSKYSTTTSDTGESKLTESSRDDLIRELNRIGKKIGRRPTKGDVLKRADYDIHPFIAEFGSWDDALSEAFTASEDDETDRKDSKSTYQENIPLGGLRGLDQSDDEPAETDDTDADETFEADGSDTTGISGTSDPDKKELLESIAQTAESLGKRPTISEFNSYSEYNTSGDIYSYFDSWADALDAADIDSLSRAALLEDIRRLETKLGYPPLSSHVDEQGEFSTYDYKHEFGSVDAAVEEAGFDVESRVRDSIRELIENSTATPKMTELEEYLPYSTSTVYKFFGSWDEALSAVKEEERGANQDGSDDDTEKLGSDSISVKQNELSEQYELLWNLRTLCTAVIKARDNAAGEEAEHSEAMDQWVEEIEAFWTEGPSTADNYGAQQSDRNPFTMRAYRKEFGDGTQVTEFELTPCTLPSRTIQTLLTPIVEVDFDHCYLPVDAQTGAPFPIIVESEYELEWAVGMLHRLPAEPAAASPAADESETTENGASEPTSNDDALNEDDQPDETELLEVNGVTEEIAASLNKAGYHTIADLKAASMDTLGNIDNISSQVAMRIKLNVGE